MNPSETRDEIYAIDREIERQKRIGEKWDTAKLMRSAVQPGETESAESTAKRTAL